MWKTRLCSLTYPPVFNSTPLVNFNLIFTWILQLFCKAQKCCTKKKNQIGDVAVHPLSAAWTFDTHAHTASAKSLSSSFLLQKEWMCDMLLKTCHILHHHLDISVRLHFLLRAYHRGNSISHTNSTTTQSKIWFLFKSWILQHLVLDLVGFKENIFTCFKPISFWSTAFVHSGKHFHRLSFCIHVNVHHSRLDGK